jgi:magnesium and cobalt exporter, CNNM family
VAWSYADLPAGDLIGILVCLFFSAFFSASETALTSLSLLRTEQIIERHAVLGRALRVWKNNPNGVLATILIGNNIFNITASALATDLASNLFPSRGIPIAIGGMTFLLLFSGEITPKTIARSYADVLAPILMLLVLGFHVLFYPVSWTLTWFIRGLFRLFGGRHRRRDRVTEDDIEYIVSLGRRQGTLDKDKEHLLSSIFEFSDTTAREIMVPRTDIIATPVDANYEKVVEISLESGFSRIPVFEESIDKIVGIFYTKNLITPPLREEQSAFLASRMRPAVFVPESKKISEVLKLFQRERIHMAIVVDEFGGTGGLVTMEDIIEELLGEIQDEFDSEEERLVKAGEGAYIADARVNVEELEDEFGLRFPEDRDYESLGGFLMEMAQEVPTEGWEHIEQGYRFRVMEADPQRVIKVHIEPAPEPDEAAAEGAGGVEDELPEDEDADVPKAGQAGG